MKPVSTDEVVDLLNGSFTAAALGAALELGLFWLLDKGPLDAAQISTALSVPGRRCEYWLRLVEHAGLLRKTDEGYAPSSVARACIMEAYSQETWAFLAQEAREMSPALRDLALHIQNPGSVIAAIGFEPTNYVSAMTQSPERAQRFTRMLYEIHRPIAEELASCLDLRGIRRFMDLGGGSGVVSLALLRQYPDCEAVVVDIDTVCRAGSEIAQETPVHDRITYHAADFLKVELPGDFDLVLECDVGEYGHDLLCRIHSALKPGGRFVIVDQFAPSDGSPRPGHLHWAFDRSLRDPTFRFPTAAEIRQALHSAGFAVVVEKTISSPGAGSATFDKGHTIIEAVASPQAVGA